MYYKNRYYLVTVGRFLQRDPREYVDSADLYVYVLNDPVGTTDPRGLFSDKEIAKRIRRSMELIEDPPDGETRCHRIRVLYATLAYGGGFLGYTDAARNLLHWLRGSGTRMSVGRNLLMSDLRVLDFMRKVRRAALAYVAGTACAADHGTTPRFTKSIKATDRRLYYAMGTFTVKGYAWFEKRPQGGDCKRWLRFRWDTIDTYDWHAELNTDFCGVRVPDKYALEREQCDVQHPKLFKMGDTYTEDFGCVSCFVRPCI